jgi:hypothetical protein
MQNLQEQNSTTNTEMLDPQPLSYPKRIEIWIGRLAMVGVTTTVTVIVLNAA